MPAATFGPILLFAPLRLRGVSDVIQHDHPQVPRERTGVNSNQDYSLKRINFFQDDKLSMKQ